MKLLITQGWSRDLVTRFDEYEKSLKNGDLKSFYVADDLKLPVGYLKFIA